MCDYHCKRNKLSWLFVFISNLGNFQLEPYFALLTERPMESLCTRPTLKLTGKWPGIFRMFSMQLRSPEYFRECPKKWSEDFARYTGYYFEIATRWSESYEWHDSSNLSVGSAVASWLVCSTPDRVVWVRALARVITMCSWAKHAQCFSPSMCANKYRRTWCCG